ncbi:MAG: hypothetical protein ACJAWV_002741 [Flammeovirgaceae bacterium]|jgi:hypothetical protein
MRKLVFSIAILALTLQVACTEKDPLPIERGGGD